MIKFIEDKELGKLRVNDFDGFLQDGEAIFFARQLEHIKAASYDVKYADLKFREVFPVSNEARPGTRVITYRTYDQAGMAKLIGAYSKDIPRADIAGKETSSPVRDGATSIGYTMAELRSAQLTGLPLDARRMAAAMRAHEQLMNTIAWFGDTESGLQGVLNNDNLSIGEVAEGTASGTPTEWADKTPAEILFDLHSIANDIWTDSKMVERPDTILLPPTQYKLIESTRVSTIDNMSILKSFLQNSTLIKNVIPINELAGAGTQSADVMMCYAKDPSKLTFEIPMEPIWHPEQRQGLEIVIPSECSIGGLIVYYPMSIKLREGI